MNKILVIAYHYPPENGSCSEKNTRIVQKLIKENFEVVVVTKAYDKFPEIENKTNLTIIRTKANGIFHRVRSNINSGSKNCGANKSKIKQNISNLLIPDAVIDWIAEIKKLTKKYHQLFGSCDMILSISSPYSAHIASNYLSKKLNIPFIMCYGDPWIYEPKRKRGKIRYLYEKHLERKLITASSGINLITEWNRRKYIELYNIPEHKINTYLIGYSDTGANDIHNNLAHNNIRMLYGGSLDPVHRDVRPFFKALKHLNNIYVEIRNDDFPRAKEYIAEYNVKDKVKILPLVSSLEFDRMQYDFDILVLFGNRTPFQIPGKVFTYISTGKTIFYIKNNDDADDGTENVLRKYGNCIIAQNKSDEIVKAIEKFIQNRKTNIKVNKEEFLYTNTMQPIIEMINRVLNNE